MALRWDRLRIEPGLAGRVRCEPGWRLDRRWSDRLADCDLWLVWAGRGTMRLRDATIDLRPGVCIWARPGGLYLAEQDRRDRLGVSFQHFCLTDRRTGRPVRRGELPAEVHTVLDIAAVDAVMRRVRALGATDKARPIAATLMRGLLMDITAGPRAAITGTQRHHHDIAAAAVAKIAEAPDQPWPVACLAAEAGYSPDHFTRIFREQTGCSPQEHQINVRIERAGQLLADSPLTVSQIAAALGYRDVAFFSRQFKHRTGRSPSAYRGEA